MFSPDEDNEVGSFDGLDMSSIDAKTTYDPDNANTSDTCKPVAYYATDVPSADQMQDFDSGINSGFWKILPDDLSGFDRSSVKAIAIDCRKTDKGNDFVLDTGRTLVAYVGLVASSDKSDAGRTETNEAVVADRTFSGTKPATSDTVKTMTAERSLKLLAADLSIEKTCDPASGTKDQPAEIGNEANKKLTYTIKVTNKATDENLPDVRRIHVNDVLPQGLSLDTDGAITVSSSSLGIAEGTNISDQSVVSYQTGDDGVSFDIGKLPSQGSVSITVPVVRKDPVSKTTTYVNTATIETIGNAEDNQSSSTYHKTTVTSLPLAGGSGFGGLVAVGCALVGVSAAVWIRRRRKA